MLTRPHGGSCCGVRHIAQFSIGPKEALKRIIKSSNGQCKVRGVLLEVVLTDSQIKRKPCLVSLLQETQFTLVSRFINKNSGNTCNVFHFHPNPLSVDSKDLPFDWKKNE